MDYPALANAPGGWRDQSESGGAINRNQVARSVGIRWRDGSEYAGGMDFIDRSDDSGATWKTVTSFDDDPDIDDADHQVTDLTTFPSNHNHLLAATYEPDSDTTAEGKAKVYRSTDGGTTWIKVYEQPNDNHKGIISSVTISPTNDSVVFVTYRDTLGVRIAKSSSYADSGSWSDVGNRLSSSAEPLSLTFNPRNGSVLYLGTDGQGMYKSTNNGLTWLSSGLSGHEVRDVAVSYSDTTVVWAATDSGVYLSTNAGSSWTLKDSLMVYKDGVNFKRCGN